jgi:hypothetical protein
MATVKSPGACGSAMLDDGIVCKVEISKELRSVLEIMERGAF